MVRSSLRDHGHHGVHFFKYLSLTNRIDINERGKLHFIFSEEFNRLPNESQPKYNFSTVLYSLKSSGYLEVTGQLITITTQFQKMIDGLKASRWILQLLQRTEPNRPETFADKVRISSPEHPFKGEKMSFSVDINTEHTVSLDIENTGSKIIHFTGYKHDCRSSNISLEDEHGATQEKPLVLHPDHKHEVCKVKFSACEVGVLSMKLSFEFREGFCIERIFEAYCVTPLGKELGPTAPYRTRPVLSPIVRPSSKFTIEDGQPPPGFHKRKHYNMPLSLHGLADALKNPRSTDERKMILQGNLKWENYKQRFDLLLALERSQMESDLKRSNIPNDDQQEVTMEMDRFNKTFLIVKVPGLMENRVSVLRGDHVLVYPAQEIKLKYCLYVESVQQDTLKLGYNKKLLERYVPNMKFHIEFELNTVNIGIQHRAAKYAVTNNLKAVLFPHAAPSSAPLPDLKLYDKKLEQNPEQYQAVQHIVAGSSKPAPYLVFGPPGTGKTVTVAEAIKQVRKYHPSSVILACAPTNSAADQLCENILKHVDQCSVLRIYAKCINPSDITSQYLKACSNLNGNNFDFPKDYKEKLMTYKVIITTLFTSSRLVTANVPKGHFTHVFVDEAGQAIETECLLPLAGLLDPKSGQVVLAGDPKQLGPIIKCPLALKFGLSLSLLERLMTLYKKHEDAFDKCFVTKLLHNYRSHPAIFTIPNELFYDGELKPFANDLCNSYCDWEHLPQKGFPIIFHEVTGREVRESCSPSFFNVAEVDVLMDYVKKLLQTQGKKGHSTLFPKDIGIITPYWKQVRPTHI